MDLTPERRDEILGDMAARRAARGWAIEHRHEQPDDRMLDAYGGRVLELAYRAGREDAAQEIEEHVGWHECAFGFDAAAIARGQADQPRTVQRDVTGESAGGTEVYQVKKIGYSVPLALGTCAGCGEELFYNLAAGVLLHDDEDSTCTEPYPVPVRTQADGQEMVLNPADVTIVRGVP